MQIFYIGLGGFCGAVLRYWISGWVYKLSGSSFPWGTLVVNILGSLILGLFLALAENRYSISPSVRNFFAVGIMGALTTFSTFSYETFRFVQENLFGPALLNIGLNCVLTLVAVWLGFVLSRFI